jgi:tetratricopeptide (TPR) repeat protein
MIYNWLSNESNGSWLMILDNADDAKVFFGHGGTDICRDATTLTVRSLASYLPQSRHGSILVTSRDRDAAIRLTGHSGRLVEVNAMNLHESMALLETRIKVEKSTQLDAEQLLRELDYIPLAITQAAAYIDKRKPRMTILGYLELLRENESNLGQLLNEDQGDLWRDQARPNNAIIATWEISFNQIRVDEASAADMLALMSALDRQGIPESLLRTIYTNRCDFQRALDPLIDFSLVNADSQGNTFGMHRLVQVATHRWLDLQGKLAQWQEKAIQLISNNFPDGNHENWPECQTLYPHAVAVLGFQPSSIASLLEQASIQYNMAWYDWARGNYTAAEEKIILASKIQMLYLPEIDGLLLDTISLHALLLRDQGDYNEAKKLFVQVMETRKRVLGQEHPETLASINNLASTYRNQGRWKEAEELETQVLETRKRVLGQEHPDTLRSINNLASTYRDQGRWKEAEELETQVLETTKRVLGQEHPDTLTSMANLAVTWKDQGCKDEALVLMKECVQLKKKVLGLDHPDTKSGLQALIKWETER